MILNMWTVLCQHALIDHESKNATLVECVTHLKCPKPTIPEGVVGVQVPLNLWIVSCLMQERVGVGASGQVRLKIMLPSGQEVISGSGGIAVPATGGVIVKSQLMFHPVNVEGRYWHVLEFAEENEPDAWREVTRYPLDVSFLEASSAEG